MLRRGGGQRTDDRERDGRHGAREQRPDDHRDGESDEGLAAATHRLTHRGRRAQLRRNLRTTPRRTRTVPPVTAPAASATARSTAPVSSRPVFSAAAVEPPPVAAPPSG